MSDIKVGDLVVVSRPWVCCEKNKEGMGAVRVVRAVGVPDTQGCFICRAKYLAADLGDGLCPMNRLKRIPQLSELEGEKRDEEITA